MLTSGVSELLIVVFLMILMFSGFPVVFSLISVAVIGYIVLVSPNALAFIFSSTFGTITKDIYLAIPLYILMASILQMSGLGGALYEAMYKWMAGLKGGLAMGTIVICTLLAAMTSLVGPGTIITGLLAYPEMRKRGYDKYLAIGCVPAGGTLGPLIPPSIILIVVAGIANVSVGKMFIGAVIPGLMMSACFIGYIGIRCLLNPSLGPPIPISERATLRDKLKSLRGTILPILLIVLILGGIYAGIFTPTEAGAIGVFGALFCSAFYRELNWKDLKESLYSSFKINSMVFWLLIGGSAFSSLFAASGANNLIKMFLAELAITPFTLVVVMIVIVLVLGMIIETFAICIITLPIFVPIVIASELDILWFAIAYSIALIISVATPPFGYSLYYFKGLGHSDVSMGDIYLAILPYALIMVLVSFLCLFIPQLLVWLPNAMIE